MPFAFRKDVQIGYIDHQEYTNNALIAMALAYGHSWVQNEPRIPLGSEDKPSWLAPDGCGEVYNNGGLLPFTLEIDHSASKGVEKTYDSKLAKNELLFRTQRYQSHFQRQPVFLVLCLSPQRSDSVRNYFAKRKLGVHYLVAEYQKFISSPLAPVWTVPDLPNKKISLRNLQFS